MLDFLSTSNISPLLLSYGYIAYLVLATIEGPIVTVIAGSLVALGYFDFLVIYILAIAGDMIGDLLYYAIGRWGGRWLRARGGFLGVKIKQAEKLETHFRAHAGKTILLGKWSQVIGAPILVAAGMAKMPLGKFIWLNVIGTLPKALLFLLIGYYFGQAYRQIDTYFGYASLAIACTLALIAAVYFLSKRKKSQ